MAEFNVGQCSLDSCIFQFSIMNHFPTEGRARGIGRIIKFNFNINSVNIVHCWQCCWKGRQAVWWGYSSSYNISWAYSGMQALSGSCLPQNEQYLRVPSTYLAGFQPVCTSHDNWWALTKLWFEHHQVLWDTENSNQAVYLILTMASLFLVNWIKTHIWTFLNPGPNFPPLSSLNSICLWTEQYIDFSQVPISVNSFNLLNTMGQHTKFSNG